MIINIYLHINNKQEIMHLPVIPSELEMGIAYKNSTKETVTRGAVRLIGNRELQTLNIQSFFPSQDEIHWENYKKKGRNQEYFKKENKEYATLQAWDYVNIIKAWISREVPIRVIITEGKNEILNLPMSIDKFSYSIKDGSGDVYYNLQLTEFAFVNIERRKGEKNA